MNQMHWTVLRIRILTKTWISSWHCQVIIITCNYSIRFEVTGIVYELVNNDRVIPIRTAADLADSGNLQKVER